MAEGEIECLGPEAKARIEIDRQLEACGWVVQRYRQINLGAGRGVAVREFPMVKGSRLRRLPPVHRWVCCTFG